MALDPNRRAYRQNTIPSDWSPGAAKIINDEFTRIYRLLKITNPAGALPEGAADGSLLVLTDGVWTELPINTTQSRYLGNPAGVPGWEQVNLADGVSGYLPVGNIVAASNPTDVLTGSGWAAGTASAAWTFITSQVCAGAAQYDFPNLSAYTDIRVVIRAVTQSSTGVVQMRVSTDNGSTFLAASGDYIGVSGSGVTTNTTELAFFATNATAARDGFLLIEGFNGTQLKTAHATFFSTDSVGYRVIPTTTALNAVRVLTSGAGNLSGGTIYVFGR